MPGHAVKRRNDPQRDQGAACARSGGLTRRGCRRTFRGMSVLRRTLLMTTLASALGAQRAATDVCASRTSPAAALDLYCIDLVPTPDFSSVSGAVELRRVPTPYGVSVTADGRHRWN